MRTITLFAAGTAFFILIGVDAWLCNRTLTPAHWLGHRLLTVNYHLGCEGFACFAQ